MLLTEDMVDVFIISGENEDQVKTQIANSQTKINASFNGRIQSEVSIIGASSLNDEEDFVMV